MNSIRFIWTLMLCLVVSVASAQDPGEIEGVVIEEHNESVMGAIIEVFSGGIKRGGTATDVDGHYMIKPLAPGTYEVTASYQPYKRVRVQQVTVHSNNSTRINVAFKPTQLEEIVIIYQAPLIPPDGKVISGYSAKDIKEAPTRDMRDIVTLQQGIRGNYSLNTSPPRGDDNITYLDGVMIRGTVPNLPAQVDTPKKKKRFFSFLKRKKHGK